MYAIVEVAGKQYKVAKDMTVNVNKIDKTQGDDITLEKVLMVVDGEKSLVGTPYLSNVKVSAKVMGVDRGKKVRGIKFKKRKNYTRTFGSTPEFTTLKIGDVTVM
ncbi:MAG TPA: 50S ribosomal protein L21 [Spirochaetota bacterium]|nr:50S ribosomal protein L21 [Spirochaetota bacterium]